MFIGKGMDTTFPRPPRGCGADPGSNPAQSGIQEACRAGRKAGDSGKGRNPCVWSPVCVVPRSAVPGGAVLRVALQGWTLEPATSDTPLQGEQKVKGGTRTEPRLIPQWCSQPRARVLGVGSDEALPLGKVKHPFLGVVTFLSGKPGNSIGPNQTLAP